MIKYNFSSKCSLDRINVIDNDVISDRHFGYDHLTMQEQQEFSFKENTSIPSKHMYI